MHTMTPYCVSLFLTIAVALAGEPQPAGTAPSDNLRPLPAWVKEIYEKDYAGYKFDLPATVRKEHPRLPHPSEKLVKLARENLAAVLAVNREMAKDPGAMYMLTGDKKYFDEAVAFLKTAELSGRQGSTRYAFTLDWLYNDLPEDVRSAAVEKCAKGARAQLERTKSEFSAVITQSMLRQGLVGQAESIAVWGHTPAGDELLKTAHRYFFQGYMPTWHLAMGPEGGTVPLPTDPYYGNILQEAIPWGMEMWSSFLGVDLFKANPWIEAYGYQPIDFALPNLCGVPYGDCPRPNSTFSALQCPILASRYDNPYIRWIACTYTVGKQTMPIFTRNIDTTGHWAEYDLSSRPLRDPKDGLPRERFYRGWGAVSMRSDWTENGTFAMFRIGDVVSNHNHADSGMFFIYRNGVLASDRGTFTGDFRAGNHYKNFSPLAIAHNVVTVRDPADKFVPNDGGQRAVAAQMGLYGQPGTVAKMVWERPEEIKPELVISRQAGGGYAARRYWETGDMLAYDPAEEYVYAAGDVTAAYQNSLSEWGSAESAPRSRTKRLKVMTRAFLYIRPDYFAVFDRVDALKPEFEKKWLLQMALEPKIDGDTVVVERNDLIKSRYALRIGRMKTPTESPAWHEYQNHGKMFCKTLLPREFKIEKVGGPGKEFWVDGKNYDDLGEGNKANPAPCPGDVGSWRVEVSPKEGRTLDCFLHVMQVGDSKGLEKMVPVEYIEKDGMVGFTMAANGGTYTVLFNQETGIGGHITFEKDGKRAIDRDFAMTLGENRKPQSAGAGGAKP